MSVFHVKVKSNFRALLIMIKSNCSSTTKSASKRDRELKRLTCSINYDLKEGSVSRGRSKGRGIFFFFFYEAKDLIMEFSRAKWS